MLLEVVSMVRARSALVVLLAVALLTAGCAGGDDSGGSNAAKARGRVGPATSSTLVDSDETTSTTSASASGDGTSAPGSNATPPGAAPGAPGVPPDPNSAEATLALNAYFDALLAEKYTDAARVSTGAPLILAQVRGLLQRYNQSQGGTTSQSYTARSFTVTASSPTRVAFTGRAALKTTTTAGERRGTVTAEFTGPVVTKGVGWQMAELTLDGQPVVFHASGKEARHPSAPVTLRVIGALSAGKSTAVIVYIRTERQVHVQIDEDALKWASGARNSRTRFLAGNDAYFSYGRRDDRPTAWRARVDVDGNVATMNIPFS